MSKTKITALIIALALVYVGARYILGASIAHADSSGWYYVPTPLYQPTTPGQIVPRVYTPVPAIGSSAYNYLYSVPSVSTYGAGYGWGNALGSSYGWGELAPYNLGCCSPSVWAPLW